MEAGAEAGVKGAAAEVGELMIRCMLLSKPLHEPADARMSCITRQANDNLRA